jgi:hypothetical protein
MALVSRSVRRGSTGRRWVIAGIVITLFVLLIDASLHSRSPGPDNQLATGAWVDRALPLMTASTEEGRQLAAIWSDGLHLPAASLSLQLDQISSNAAAAYRQAAALRPPDNLAGPAGLLDASLLARSEAAAAVRDALAPVVLGNRSPAGPASGAASLASGAASLASSATILAGIETAGQDLQVGDQAYRLFLRSLPNLGVAIPSSVWGADPTPYQPAKAQIFLISLENALSATAVHQLRIDAITTSPGLVASRGNVQVLPDSPAMSVTVVLSDTGNQPENDLTVTAAIASRTTFSSVRDFVSLTAGQSQTVQSMGPLIPPHGVDVHLTVTVTPPAGSPTPPVTHTITFMMPPTAPATTTTTPRAG